MTVRKRSQIGHKEEIEEELDVGCFLIMLELWVIEQRLVSRLNWCLVNMQVRFLLRPLILGLARPQQLVGSFFSILEDSAIVERCGSSCCPTRVLPQQREMNTERATRMIIIIKYVDHNTASYGEEGQAGESASGLWKHYVSP